MFVVGEDCEAIDGESYWCAAHVIKVIEDDHDVEKYLVSFKGFSRKWDRIVVDTDIRPPTPQAQVGIYFSEFIFC